jgi:hypothetical protein
VPSEISAHIEIAFVTERNQHPLTRVGFDAALAVLKPQVAAASAHLGEGVAANHGHVAIVRDGNLDRHLGGDPDAAFVGDHANDPSRRHRTSDHQGAGILRGLCRNESYRNGFNRFEALLGAGVTANPTCPLDLIARRIRQQRRKVEGAIGHLDSDLRDLRPAGNLALGDRHRTVGTTSRQDGQK